MDMLSDFSIQNELIGSLQKDLYITFCEKIAPSEGREHGKKFSIDAYEKETRAESIISNGEIQKNYSLTEILRVLEEIFSMIDAYQSLERFKLILNHPLVVSSFSVALTDDTWNVILKANTLKELLDQFSDSLLQERVKLLYELTVKC